MNLEKTLFISLLIAFLGSSCVTPPKDSDDPSAAFEKAKAPYLVGNYEFAIRDLGKFKTRFPYSKFAIEAELLIANSHFEAGEFAEAAAAYDSFAKLHPKHKEVSFALFRVGYCFWMDAPDEENREQQFTELAIEKWQVLLKRFPKSKYSDEAKGYIKIGRRRIAMADEFSTKFYCRKEIWHACAYRCEKLIEKHGDYPDILQTAYKKGAEAFQELAKAYTKDSDKNIYYKSMNKEELLRKARSLEAKVKD